MRQGAVISLFKKGKRMLKRHVTAILLIAAASLLVYSNTFRATFHFDDVPTIVENPEIKDINNLREILQGPRGVSMATFALNYAVGGLDVFGYHAINIMIHIANGILVYLLIFLTLSSMGNPTQSYPKGHKPFFKGGDKNIPSLAKGGAGGFDGWYSRIAMYVALIFVVHPVQTQAVTYIVQRMETLASLFYLLALLLFIKGAASSRMVSTIFLYIGVVVSYILGFKSKEIVITLPAIIFLYDFYFLNDGKIKGLLRRWPLYAILGIILAYLVEKTLFPGGISSTAHSVISGSGFNDMSDTTAGFGVKEITPMQYLYTQFNVIMTYLRLLIIPVKQNLDYDYAVSSSLFELRTLLSFIGVISILSAAVYLFMRPVSWITRHGRIISFFIFWFFVILSPTTSFVPIQDVIFEHRVYLPSVGFIAIFVILLDEFVNKFKKVE